MCEVWGLLAKAFALSLNLKFRQSQAFVLASALLLVVLLSSAGLVTLRLASTASHMVSGLRLELAANELAKSANAIVLEQIYSHDFALGCLSEFAKSYPELGLDAHFFIRYANGFASCAGELDEPKGALQDLGAKKKQVAIVVEVEINSNVSGFRLRKVHKFSSKI